MADLGEIEIDALLFLCYNRCTNLSKIVLFCLNQVHALQSDKEESGESDNEDKQSSSMLNVVKRQTAPLFGKHLRGITLRTSFIMFCAYIG
jgi:hypothetical protein